MGLRGAVSGRTSVLIGVSRLSRVSVCSGVVSGVRWMTKLLSVSSSEPEEFVFVVVFIFGSWGPIGVVGGVLYLEGVC